MNRTIACASFVLLACGGKSEDPIVVEVTGTASSTDVVKGSFVVDGAPATLGACKPGHSTRPFVELVTSKGKLRFENQVLYWHADPNAITRGSELACSKLDRSWGGGVRMPGDGTSYWRGKLWFRCESPAKLEGELELDCGNITPTERAQLDGKRQDLLDQQHGSSSP